MRPSTHAKEFSKKSRRADDGAGRADGDATEEEDDDLDEELVYISSSKADNSDWSCESLSGFIL